ncbi:unnamed protein product, partial [Rotaria socialis]
VRLKPHLSQWLRRHWVEGATTLFTLHKRQTTALTWKAHNDNQEIALATVQKPNDGKQPVEDRREVPMPILRQCIEELINNSYCFEKIKKILVPEKASYRLTQNLQNALGIAGLKGVFSLSSENVLKILRNGKQILLNLLESFIDDPLIDWIGHDTGVLAAFYGGQNNLYEETTVKKRQVEKDALLRMFQLRQIKIRQNWITIGPKRLQTIRTDMNTAKYLVLTLYQNLEDILINSTVQAHIDLKPNIFYDKLHDFFENHNVLISTSPAVLAADFLQTVGKTTPQQPTVANIFKNLVDLCQYLPIDYIESSLLTKPKDCLSELCNNFTTEKYLNYKYLFINHLLMLLFIKIYLIQNFKNLLNNFELTTIPFLIRGACSKQNSLIVCMDLLNNAFQTNPTYDRIKSSNEIFDTFLSLSDSFDDLNKELNKIYTLFQTLDIPLVWLQSPLFDWTQTNIDNDLHQQFLTNFFAMSKIRGMGVVMYLL